MAAKSAFKLWVSDKAAWPIMGILTGAMTMMTYSSVRYITAAPDVRVKKDPRMDGLYNHADQAVSFTTHRQRFATLKDNPINTFRKPYSDPEKMNTVKMAEN